MPGMEFIYRDNKAETGNSCHKIYIFDWYISMSQKNYNDYRYESRQKLVLNKVIIMENLKNKIQILLFAGLLV